MSPQSPFPVVFSARHKEVMLMCSGCDRLRMLTSYEFRNFIPLVTT